MRSIGDTIAIETAKNSILLSNMDPVEKMRLMDELSRAASAPGVSNGSFISISGVIGAGFIALGAWLTTKFLGFSPMSQGISSLIGGGAGYTMFR